MKNQILCIVLACCFFSCSSTKTASNAISITSSTDLFSFKGGNGNSFKKAVVIIAKNSKDGADAEYYFLDKKYGREKSNWYLIQKDLVFKENKPYDVLKIKELSNNNEISVYFEISSFYGKY